MFRTIFRTIHDKDKPYLVSNKEAIHELEKTNLLALGLYISLTNSPDDWQINVNELSKRCKTSKYKIYKAIKILKSLGYLYHHRVRSGKNWTSAFYLVFETKKSSADIKEILRMIDLPFLQNRNVENRNDVLSNDSYQVKKERKKEEEKKRKTGILTDPVCADAQTPSIFSKKVKEKKKPSKEALELAKYFFDKLLENDETLIAPDFDQWALELDRINQVDKQSFDDIERIIGFVTTDKFWKKAISSPSGLRKKWNSIALQAPKSHVDGRPTMRMKIRWAKNIQESLPDRSKMAIDDDGVTFHFENQEPKRLLFSDERFDKEIVDTGAKLRNHQYSVLVSRRLAVNA